ncbi:MAG: winged helix-turn-helix transcriptional regulator [Streptosporangiaceae bacterium]|nr:winged helix-turn-helix transcriptional regulator [Streptosporangiaceae bacterium]
MRKDPAGTVPENDPAGTVPENDPAGTVLEALADPVRRRVVTLLGSKPLRAGELAAAAGVSAPTMSKHLRALLRAGVVADERGDSDARVRVFRLRPQSIAAVRAWLDQLQAHWDEQLASFKRHVEEGTPQ